MNKIYTSVPLIQMKIQAFLKNSAIQINTVITCEIPSRLKSLSDVLVGHQRAECFEARFGKVRVVINNGILNMQCKLAMIAIYSKISGCQCWGFEILLHLLQNHPELLPEDKVLNELIDIGFENESVWEVKRLAQEFQKAFTAYQDVSSKAQAKQKTVIDPQKVRAAMHVFRTQNQEEINAIFKQSSLPPAKQSKSLSIHPKIVPEFPPIPSFQRKEIPGDPAVISELSFRRKNLLEANYKICQKWLERELSELHKLLDNLPSSQFKDEFFASLDAKGLSSKKKPFSLPALTENYFPSPKVSF